MLQYASFYNKNVPPPRPPPKKKKKSGVILHPYLPIRATSLYNGHFPLSPRCPLWRGSTVLYCCYGNSECAQINNLSGYVLAFEKFFKIFESLVTITRKSPKIKQCTHFTSKTVPVVIDHRLVEICDFQ